ncbi:kinase-like protein [Tothia fuscella]|uniref:cyclin-dependent kinase n=1 Tax=Tothia fuscella TaxID=1048955 RepID=A0A9P4NHS0_9PEZI|nr:kinase-like protein [Tothia fuscella]
MAAEPWHANLSFSDRLDKIVQITAEYKSAHPDAPAAEASKKAKELELDIFSSSNEILQYQSQCNAQIRSLQTQPKSRDQPFGFGNGWPEVVEEGTSSGKAGTKKIGRYGEARHFQNGLFSEIYKATIPYDNPEGFAGEPGKAVALKVTFLMGTEPPHDPAREIRTLKKAAHPRIIPLLESFPGPDSTRQLVLVTPFMPYDLAMILRNGYIAEDHGRTYLRCIFEALAYLHSQGIIHRDVKPGNILMKSLSGPAYLADFGIVWVPDDPTSEAPDEKITDVGTTSYRPPEILFGNKSYGCSLDAWAAGCVAAQVITSSMKPLFDSGDMGSDLTLIQSIFKGLGTPTLEMWPEAEKLPNWGKVQWVEYEPQSWDVLLPKASVEGRDLVSHLVKYQSTERMSAGAALKQPFFDREGA